MFIVKRTIAVIRCREILCSRPSNLSWFTMSSSASSIVEDVLVSQVAVPANSSEGSLVESTNGNGLGDAINIDHMIKIDKTPYTIVTEGKAEVLFPSSHDVFYNPVQEFNRDLSVAVLKQYLKAMPLVDQGKCKKKCASEDSPVEVKVLEALAASGLRSIRYAKEVPGLTNIVANDMSFQAYESIERNVKYNKVEHLVTPSREEAALLMCQHRNFRKRFNVVDIDPYGTPSPFLDAAVQCVTDGGLLMVTCTDMAVLCGNAPEACHAKYGATSLKANYCHEMALRILLQSIESHANRHGRYIEPIISLSADFYIRIFVRIFSGLIKVKRSFCKLGMVYDCMGCSSFHIQPLGKCIETEKGIKYAATPGPPVNTNCNICGEKHKIGGPIWIADLHDKDFIRQVISQVEEEHDSYQTSKRILGVLNVILEELDGCPLFYRIDRMCAVVHASTPSALKFRSALLSAGYRVSLSHVTPNSFKTDAPPEVIWDIIRAWVKLVPGKKSFELEPSKTILSKESSIQVSFDLHPDANPESRAKNLLRFQINPQPNWGPKCRATTSLWADKDVEKCKRKRARAKENKDLKQFPCKKFKQNECDKGDECKYSHESIPET